MSPFLELAGIEAAYGSSQVLFGMSLGIAQGEAVALLGRNGMGKTSTVRVICGLLRPSVGTLYFRGRDLAALPPEEIARLGVAVVPEGRQIFGNLTVAENLAAFTDARNDSLPYWTVKRVFELFPRLAERRTNMGNHLSGGEQQMLAIGRALVTNPHLLVLDEATEGLAPLLREEIWSCLTRLRGQGQSILIIDKYVRKLIAFADQHVVIERGRAVWSGTSAELANAPEIWARYLGV